MIIRAFEEKDRHAVIALWQACGLTAPQNDPNKDIDRKLKVNPELFLLGFENTELVATVMGGYEGHRGWINYLGVHPSAQHKGYGKQIMQAVEEKLRAKGCPKINLQVRTSNQQVIDFYTTLGYGEDNVVGLGKRLEQDC
jgi:ribosomal protein S18 acetylase RimI-like enzyme